MDNIIKHKKRVLFPWIKDKEGILYKTMLAVLAEKYKFSSVINGKIPFTKHVRMLIEEVEILFPNMFDRVSKYYLMRDRKLSKKEYMVIVIGRFRMMYKYNKKSNKVTMLGENPYNNISQFGETIKKCESLIVVHPILSDEKIMKEFMQCILGGKWWLC